MKCLPRTSAAWYPNSRSAAKLNDSKWPCSSIVTIPSAAVFKNRADARFTFPQFAGADSDLIDHAAEGTGQRAEFVFGVPLRNLQVRFPALGRRQCDRRSRSSAAAVASDRRAKPNAARAASALIARVSHRVSAMGHLDFMLEFFGGDGEPEHEPRRRRANRRSTVGPQSLHRDGEGFAAKRIVVIDSRAESFAQVLRCFAHAVDDPPRQSKTPGLAPLGLKRTSEYDC